MNRILINFKGFRERVQMTGKIKLKNVVVWLTLIVVLGGALPSSMRAAVAGELDEGFIIDGTNFDSAMASTFEGHSIDSMFSDAYKNLIKQDGMKVRLGHSKPWDEDKRLVNLTSKFSPLVRFDETTNRVEGFQVGIPFPQLDIKNDPKAGWKLAYNIVYSAFLGDVLHWPTIDFVMVGEKGYERSITYTFALYQMLGRRSTGDTHIEGDGTIRSLTTLVAINPSDVRGIGSFAIRYADGRLDDIYVYLRSVRRFRRVSGGAWYDPVQGSDFLLDGTSNAFNADPIWYKNFQIIGKKTMLFPESDQVSYTGNGNSPSGKYPYLDLQNPPYWNVDDDKEYWRPREVYLLEATPPEGHPFSKRIFYVDTNPYVPLPFEVDNYDRAGKLWHLYSNTVNRITTEDGFPTINPILAREIDLHRRHATLLPGGSGRKVNPPGVTSADFNLEAVRKLIE